MKSKKMIPYKDLIQISPDGGFVRLSSRMIGLDKTRFRKLWKFALYALTHHEEISDSYPITDDSNFRFEIQANGDLKVYPPPINEKGEPIYVFR